MIFLRRLRLPCWYVVVGNEVLELSEPEARLVFSRATSRIAQAQKREGYPQYWLRVNESGSGLHANLIFPAPAAFVARLDEGALAKYLRGEESVQAIGSTLSDWKEVTNYVVKERTPQAEYAIGHLLGPRVRGSHNLGEGGGDRVVLSPTLRRDAVAAGVVDPYRRTTSKNLSRSTARATPENDTVVVTDGTRQEPPNVCPARHMQLVLFSDLPSRWPPFSTGVEMRTLRRMLGLTQEQFGSHIRIRARSHVANIERGHDRLSLTRRRLLQHLIETGRLAA